MLQEKLNLSNFLDMYIKVLMMRGILKNKIMEIIPNLFSINNKKTDTV